MSEEVSLEKTIAIVQFLAENPVRTEAGIVMSYVLALLIREPGEDADDAWSELVGFCVNKAVDRLMILLALGAENGYTND